MSLAATLRRTALALLHRTHLLAGFIGLAALLSLAPAAQAKDYCLFDQTVPSYVLVGRGFTIPTKGKCKAWTGFTAQAGFNSPTAGTGCTSSDGSHLALTLTTSFPQNGGDVEIDSINLSLPAQSGASNFNFLSGGTASSGSPFPVVGQVCNPTPIPAVSVNAAEQQGPVGGGLR
jgi:hypothetical protein